MEEFRNGLGGVKRSQRKGSRKRAAALAASNDDDVFERSTNDVDDLKTSTKVAKFDSPSKLKLKFVVQSSKGSEGSTTFADDKSPTMTFSPTLKTSPTKTISPSSEFTSPSKLRMKISMANKSVSMSNDDDTFDTPKVVDKLTIKTVRNVEKSSKLDNVENIDDVEMNVDIQSSGKKKSNRVPEFICDRSSRVKSYFRRRHAPFKRTFDLVNIRLLNVLL